MSLNDLTDQELNTLCCKALGWKQITAYPDYWDSGLRVPVYMPFFCEDLNTIHKYLVPALRNQPASVQQRYYQHAQRVYWQSGEADGMLDQFMLMSIPARVRVLAFLQAMGVQREP